MVEKAYNEKEQISNKYPIYSVSKYFGVSTVYLCATHWGMEGCIKMDIVSGLCIDSGEAEKSKTWKVA